MEEEHRTNLQGTRTQALVAINPDKILPQILHLIEMPGLFRLLLFPSPELPHDFTRIEDGHRNKQSKVEMTKKKQVHHSESSLSSQPHVCDFVIPSPIVQCLPRFLMAFSFPLYHISPFSCETT